MTTESILPSASPLLSREAAAHYLSCSLGMLRKLPIKRTMVGRCIKYKKTALDAYIDQNTEGYQHGKD
jgi:hypothetical protein